MLFDCMYEYTWILTVLPITYCFFIGPFCGGEAHSEMANQAERVWSVASGTVKDALDQHHNYELVITGHSLGAGTACLVHILCHSKRLVRRKMRCFAFASPPVFTPLQLIPNAVRSTTNYIHQKDVSNSKLNKRD